MQSPFVAIQIVNYKTKSFLDPLIESIIKDIAGSKVSVEITILDNASGDDLTDIGTKWSKHNVRVYTAKENAGFGAGHNTLATKTTAKYLLLLNPDMVFIEEHTVARLVESIECTGAAVVGPRLLMPKNRMATDLHKLSEDQLVQQPWDHGRSSIWRFYEDHTTKEVAWVSGAAFLISRQDLQDIGGFDEEFFLYFEEVDVCYRLRKAGRTVVYVPDVRILHYGSAVANKFSKYGLKSFAYFMGKKSKGKY